MRGGFRPNAGRPRGAKGKKTPKTLVEQAGEMAVDILAKGATETASFKSALEFAMYVINDPEAPMNAKLRLAVAAMPFQHPKLEAADSDACRPPIPE